MFAEPCHKPERGDFFFFEEVSLHKVYGPSGSREREAPTPAVGPSDGASTSPRCTPLLKSAICFHRVTTHPLAFRKRFKAASRSGSIVAFWFGWHSSKAKLKTQLKWLRVYSPDCCSVCAASKLVQLGLFGSMLVPMIVNVVETLENKARDGRGFKKAANEQKAAGAAHWLFSCGGRHPCTNSRPAEREFHLYFTPTPPSCSRQTSVGASWTGYAVRCIYSSSGSCGTEAGSSWVTVNQVKTFQ